MGLSAGMTLRLACCAFLLLGLSGCEPAKSRADLVFINGAEPETLDPSLITGQPEGRLCNALFEGLTSFTAEGKAQPGMAESWTISEDGKTYLFKIRPDARWSDGSPLTAKDFVASWKRTLMPATAASYNYQLFYIKNAQAFADEKITDFSQVGVKALDDRTLEVTLENPTSFFLDLCATPPLAPTPVALIDKVGDDWVKPGKIISNGAYMLEDWRINHRVRLKKNPYYWNAKNVALETIEALPISKATVAFNFYDSGVADLIMDKNLTPNALLEKLKSRPDFNSSLCLAVYFLRFNCTKPPFNDPRVRRAISLAIDKSRIVQKITRAGEAPATTLVPPGISGYVSPEGGAFDPVAARKLLAEAGFPDGKDFPRSTYLYNESDQNESIAVEIQSMLKENLGIEISPMKQEWKVYLSSLSSLDYDIARSSWVGDYPDPNTFLDMFLDGNGNNRTGWSDAAYDRLIADAAKEPNVAHRFEILRQAENLLVNEQSPICPIFYYVGIQLYNADKFGGISPNLLDEHPLKSIYRKDR